MEGLIFLVGLFVVSLVAVLVQRRHGSIVNMKREKFLRLGEKYMEKNAELMRRRQELAPAMLATELWKAFKRDLEAVAAKPEDAEALAKARASGLAYMKAETAAVRAGLVAEGKAAPKAAHDVPGLFDNYTEVLIKNAQRGQLPGG